MISPQGQHVSVTVLRDHGAKLAENSVEKLNSGQGNLTEVATNGKFFNHFVAYLNQLAT